jgi:uncharacterized membrane protein
MEYYVSITIGKGNFQMKWLVLIHVLSAIIGIGPTYAFHIIFRKNQSVQELRSSFKTGTILELLPKIFGSLAVVSGLTLFFVGSYGSFTQLWLIGSLILYIIIQVIIIGIVSPLGARLKKWLADPASQSLQEVPAEQVKLHNKMLNNLNLASGLGIVLFIFMILKPVF